MCSLLQTKVVLTFLLALITFTSSTRVSKETGVAVEDPLEISTSYRALRTSPIPSRRGELTLTLHDDQLLWKAIMKELFPETFSDKVENAVESACRETERNGVCKRIVNKLAGLVPGALKQKSPSSLATFLRCGVPLATSLGEEAIEQARSLRPLGEKLMACAKGHNMMAIIRKTAMHRGHSNTTGRKIERCLMEAREEVQKLGHLGYKTITIGVTGGVGPRAFEGGLAFDIRVNPGKVRAYIKRRSSTRRMAGGGGGVVVGFAKVSNDALHGKGQGVSLSGGAGILSGGIAFDFLGNNEFARASFSVRAGIRAPVSATCFNTNTEQF